MSSKRVRCKCLKCGKEMVSTVADIRLGHNECVSCWLGITPELYNKPAVTENKKR